MATLLFPALLFCIPCGEHIRPTRLTPHSARRIIQKRAHAAGVEGFISGHSLRVGSAVSLAERGAIARFKDGKR